MSPDFTKVWIALACVFILLGVLFAQQALANGYLVEDNGRVTRIGPPDRPCPPNNPNCPPEQGEGWVCQYDCCGDGSIFVDDPKLCRQQDCFLTPPECPSTACSLPKDDPCRSNRCARQREQLQN